jgi:hypothetical protein
MWISPGIEPEASLVRRLPQTASAMHWQYQNAVSIVTHDIGQYHHLPQCVCGRQAACHLPFYNGHTQLNNAGI